VAPAAAEPHIRWIRWAADEPGGATESLSPAPRLKTPRGRRRVHLPRRALPNAAVSPVCPCCVVQVSRVGPRLLLMAASLGCSACRPSVPLPNRQIRRAADSRCGRFALLQGCGRGDVGRCSAAAADPSRGPPLHQAFGLAVAWRRLASPPCGTMLLNSAAYG
jgi:hypothetical protein